MHQLLKEKYTQDNLNEITQMGQAKPVNMGAVGVIDRGLADALNRAYEGNYDIKAIDAQHSPPVHLWARVDGQDGVPWTTTVTYLLEGLSISLSEEDLMVLADETGLVTSGNHPTFYLGKMHPLASFWTEKRVLQASFLNMPPDRVIAFLGKVEERLVPTLQELKVLWPKSRVVQEQVEEMLKKDGITIKGATPPYPSWHGRPGMALVIEATHQQIQELFSKHPAWMLIEDTIFIV